MGAFICKQPNGLYCRYSTTVACPTHWNMTKEEYIEYRIKELREELEEGFERRLIPFDRVLEYFSPINMTRKEFEKFLEEVNKERKGD